MAAKKREDARQVITAKDSNGKVVTLIPFELVKTGKRGRPQKVLSEDGMRLVKNLAEIMCTEDEIAAVLETSTDTLHNKNNHEIFSECLKTGREKGKSSLRRKQWKLADTSAAMAIFLGKQYLGQKDTPDGQEESDRVTVVIDV